MYDIRFGGRTATVVRIRSGVAVAGFLATAIATVGMLTAQAADAPLRHRSTAHDGRATPAGAASPTALPGGSGQGPRVVYSLGRHHVWLVDAHEHVLRGYDVQAPGVSPATGTHRVFARAAGNAVLFASTDGVNVGFTGDPEISTSAIREAPSDAAVLWQHAPMGSLVVVVP
ncbi:hypothetical protein [Actinacidiphila yanglinensis]|uniref:hypothetical protein n=1 Tax=Actinacidiphila yanglinensis TaxID=310779 RepID=UPI0011B069B0|nr:hypothetical protein [Actinacidiphila yanglinensis]